jgi:hypothetical protein
MMSLFQLSSVQLSISLRAYGWFRYPCLCLLTPPPREMQQDGYIPPPRHNSRYSCFKPSAVFMHSVCLPACVRVCVCVYKYPTTPLYRAYDARNPATLRGQRTRRKSASFVRTSVPSRRVRIARYIPALTLAEEATIYLIIK